MREYEGGTCSWFDWPSVQGGRSRGREEECGAAVGEIIVEVDLYGVWELVVIRGVVVVSG